MLVSVTFYVANGLWAKWELHTIEVGVVGEVGGSGLFVCMSKLPSKEKEGVIFYISFQPTLAD
jgi:hypothetical protein